MKKILRHLYRSVFPDDKVEQQEPVTPVVDEASVVSDLHIFLVQLASWISDHLEYENRVGRELPSDSKLIFRFRLDDYVTELVDFFSRKQLLEGDKDLLFHAGIEVLLPPEHIREILPWRIRRQLFTRLLQEISVHAGMPYPVVTRKFYDHLLERDVINGISNKEILESYQEAIADLARVQEAEEPVAPDGSPPEGETVDTADIITKTLAACGATNYTRLTRILSRRHILEFAWLVFLYTLVAAVAIVLAEPIVRVLMEHLPVTLDESTWQIIVLAVYLMQLTIRLHILRYRSYRRRTLIRVSNAVAVTVGISYKEMDDVLHRTYGTNLKRLKSALLPRTRK